ncbi:16.9 kDa class I heat shock protein 3-like [Cornus florida]|uniref:16.9 kDa class I heat shock protein 3-like n=1 Tax=Cornus florida TaxID=4283 RepID=UPI0028A1956E|nr:16.9 kDa class I heat shock protein 3-like [Cornus florida]
MAAKDRFIFEEFTPLAGWTQDLNCHYLLVHLPDFMEDEVKLKHVSRGHFMVSGERQKSENRFIHFEQTFALPENADFEQNSWVFDKEILLVTIPKAIKDGEVEAEYWNFNEEIEHEAGLLQSVIEKLRKKNKGMVIMTLIAFSLAVLVANKFRSNGN